MHDRIMHNTIKYFKQHKAQDHYPQGISLSQLTALYFPLVCFSPYVEPYSRIHSQHPCVLQYESFQLWMHKSSFASCQDTDTRLISAQMFSSRSASPGLQVSECGSTGDSCKLWRAPRWWKMFTQSYIISR